MKHENLSALSDDALQQKLKSIKNKKITDGVLIGFAFGISVYGAAKGHWGLFTFFPLIMAFIVIRNAADTKLLESEILKELDARKVK
ncbi:hypothetical protein [Flavobacterium sp.]|uniref:hypothetical protein n=1 Tax=Flavobacterium sp. TaxID=239 RepID=UPI00260B61FA|nr:hypothetical protein [Flavobacterium sp.]